MSPTDPIARHLAERGPEAIDKMAAIVSRARTLLADRAAMAVPDTLASPTYIWESDEGDDDTAEPQIYFGSVEDNAAGFGLAVWVFAGLARSEAGFRRTLAARIGPALADAAAVATGADAAVPFENLILSRAIQRLIAGHESGTRTMATFAVAVECRVDFG